MESSSRVGPRDAPGERGATGRRRVLFVVYMDSHFGELLRVARALRDQGDFAPLFYFEHLYPTIGRSLGLCAAEGFECLGPAGRPLSASGDAPPEGLGAGPGSGTVAQALSWRRKAGALVGEVLGEGAERLLKATWARLAYRTPVGTPWWMLMSLQYLRMASRIIRQWEIRAVVVAVGGNYTAEEWFKAARSNRAGAVVVPFAMTSTQTLARVHHKRHEYRVGEVWSRLLRATRPGWIHDHEGAHLIRVPLARALAQEALGLAPPHPWIYNSTNAGVIAVESEQMLQHYRREGMPPDKLVVTGALSDDVLAAAVEQAPRRRAELHRKLSIPEQYPLVLCALPPNQFAVENAVHHSEYADYEALVEAWMSTLGGLEGCNVVVRLHPRDSLERMRYIERWGVKLTELDTAELIPLCDLYVCSFSATIRWAIACGKPVLNYDVLRHRLPFYESAGGVVTVETRDAFAATLRRCVQDPAYRASLEAAQRQAMDQWGRVDGRSASRLCGLIEREIRAADGRVP